MTPRHLNLLDSGAQQVIRPLNLFLSYFIISDLPQAVISFPCMQKEKQNNVFYSTGCGKT